jgi:hypothetical protein
MQRWRYICSLLTLAAMQLHHCEAFSIGASACLRGITVQGIAPRSPVVLGAVRARKAARMPALCRAGETIRTPSSIAEMMKDAADGVLAAVEGGVARMAVEVPLPITGGTELDDWPGGIGQKVRTPALWVPRLFPCTSNLANRIWIAPLT